VAVLFLCTIGDESVAVDSLTARLSSISLGYMNQLVGKGAFGVNIILFEESDSLDARLSAMPAGGASVGSWLGCD